MKRFSVPKLGAHDLEAGIASAFEKAQVPYAISHGAAAHRLAPFLTHVGKVRIRVVGAVERFMAAFELNAQRVDTGWNLGA